MLIILYRLIQAALTPEGIIEDVINIVLDNLDSQTQ